MATYHKLALTAGFALAMTFTFSCSGDDGGGEHTPVWGDWSVTTPATCEAAGVETRTNDISETETRPIAQLAWGDWSVATPATPTTVGEETRTCPGNASPAETRPLLPKCNGVEYNPIETKKFCDSRENKLYKFVSIGEGATAQTWMAENLNYDVPDNATDVCYDNDPDKCVTYGRLYNWATAMGGSASSTANPSGVQGVCPAGWHLPSDAEWTALTTAVGSNAGTKLKANSDLWSTNTGTDEFGFSALPGGYGNSGSFNYVGDGGRWWSSTEGVASNAYYRYMNYYSANVDRDDYVKSRLFSVRCVQD
jgi:uncharacterized protein (TIGR02145 family)